MMFQENKNCPKSINFKDTLDSALVANINRNNEMCPLNSHNEWDPLEEVIVGSPVNAMFNFWDPLDKYIISSMEMKEIIQYLTPNAQYPVKYIKAAKKDLESFVHILKSEGVVVRKIENMDYSSGFSTPDWELSNGFCGANPRDPFLIIGNEIIEAPMCARS